MHDHCKGVTKCYPLQTAGGKQEIRIVPVTVYPPAKTERINIAAPGDKLAEITDYARKSRLSRSELMVNATLHYIRANA